jgi:transposase-like protein
MIRAEVMDGEYSTAFTDEFKAEAVRLVTVEGHSPCQVDRDLGSTSHCCDVGSVNWKHAKPEQQE